MPKPALRSSSRVEWNDNCSKCGNYFLDYRKRLGWTVYRRFEAKAWAMLEPGVHHKTRVLAMASVEEYRRRYPQRYHKV